MSGPTDPRPDPAPERAARPKGPHDTEENNGAPCPGCGHRWDRHHYAGGACADCECMGFDLPSGREVVVPVSRGKIVVDERPAPDAAEAPRGDSLAWHREAERMMAEADLATDPAHRGLAQALGAIYELRALTLIPPERVRTRAVILESAGALTARAEGAFAARATRAAGVDVPDPSDYTREVRAAYERWEAERKGKDWPRYGTREQAFSAGYGSAWAAGKRAGAEWAAARGDAEDAPQAHQDARRTVSGPSERSEGLHGADGRVAG